MIAVNIYYSGTNASARKFAKEMMNVILTLREKYDLHMKADRFISEEIPQVDQ